MICNIGAIAGASSFRTLEGMSSGPAALWGLSFWRSFVMPCFVMLISGAIGWVDGTNELSGGYC